MRLSLIVTSFRSLARDDSGAALAEYAIITACIAIPMIAALTLVQTESGATLTSAGQGLTAFVVSPP